MGFHLHSRRTRGKSSYEIQMRYLEHPKINLLADQEPKNKYVKLTYKDVTTIHNNYNSMG